MDTFQMESCVRSYFNMVFIHIYIHAYTNCSLLKNIHTFNFCHQSNQRKFLTGKNFPIYGISKEMVDEPRARDVYKNSPFSFMAIYYPCCWLCCIVITYSYVHLPLLVEFLIIVSWPPTRTSDSIRI